MRDEGTAALQQTSVARVTAQQAGYFENTVAGKNYRDVVCVFLGYFYNVLWPPKVYVDK